MGINNSQASRGSAPFGVEMRVSRVGLILALSGEFDLAAVETFDEAFRQVADRDNGPLLLDLSSLRFIDSSGISSFVAANARLRGENRELTICNPAPAVERVLGLTGLLDRLARVPRPEDAVAWPGD